MDIQTVGVIGAGVMGSSLAQTLAQTGHDVILIDHQDEVLKAVKDNFIKNVRLQMMFSREPSKEDPQDVLDRIMFSTDPSDLSGARYVVENVTEKWDIKETIFKALDEICNKDCIFASDTSAIPIQKLAMLTSRPDKVIGLHFMNPVTLKPAVEMIKSPLTSQETIEVSQTLLRQMKKEWIMVNDSPGFVSNRVLMLTINEAIFLVQENVASPKDIDRVFKSCFSYKMGPLETGDLIGLDTILLSLEVLYDHLKSPKFEPCPLLKEMVAKGDLGRKSGKGFFTYPA
ncbi:MAG: 3-hydroxybutyryl-CoA dehydrogenase [Desulfobacteraceae bacterium]|nr:MAG: 3-hydroxybutyryl-CoA dehydrogenase [Desulfobacteraceae bacterium]